MQRGLRDPINPNVVTRARRRFSSQMLLAIQEQSVDSAVQLYEQTLALPCTATENLLAIEGIQVNGPWQVGNRNIIICFKGTAPHLLKALTPKEISRGTTLFDVLGSLEQNPFLTPFEIKRHNLKSFMIMPYYPSTLEHNARLTVENGCRLFDQIDNAIRFLHSQSYNHMDIKPANICLRENGDFVLVDLGSVVMKLEYSESTVVYVPSDFQPREIHTSSNKYKAVDINDWLMLGMTIAEKVFGLEVGGSAPPPTVEKLLDKLATESGDFEVLIGLIRRACMN